VNYLRNAAGVEEPGSLWNSTAVYQRQGGVWKTVHSHWSFTRHPALQNASPEAADGPQDDTGVTT
jgi:hypothetical protein